MREGRLRQVAIAAALGALALAPLAVWGLSGLGSDELIVEDGPGDVAGSSELVVMLPSADLNEPDTSGGESSVVLACVDAEDDVELRVVLPFPFSDTDGGTELPHSHELIPRTQFLRIERCRLEGTTPALEGALRDPTTQ